jgi:hypothetical protein
MGSRIYYIITCILPRQPVYKKQALRQISGTKSETGYWTEIFRAEFKTGKQNRFLRRGQDSRQDLGQVLKQDRAPGSV